MVLDIDLTSQSHVEILVLVFAVSPSDVHSSKQCMVANGYFKVLLGYSLQFRPQLSQYLQKKLSQLSVGADVDMDSPAGHDGEGQIPLPESIRETDAPRRNDSIQSDTSIPTQPAEPTHRNSMNSEVFNGNLPTSRRQSVDRFVREMQDDLANARTKLRKSEVRNSKLEIQSQKIQDDLTNTTIKLQISEARNSEVELNCQMLKDEAKGMHEQLRAFSASRARSHELLSRVRDLHNECTRLQDKIDSLEKSKDERINEFSGLKKEGHEYAAENAKLKEERDNAKLEANGWRLDYQDLLAGKRSQLIHSDPSGDLTMIEAPGNALKVDIDWVSEAGKDSLRLRIENERLTRELEKANAIIKKGGEESCDDVSNHQLQLEAAKEELRLAEDQRDRALQGHSTLLREIQMDPNNRFHPIYKRIEALEHKNHTLENELLHAKALSWDRRGSMVP